MNFEEYKIEKKMYNMSIMVDEFNLNKPENFYGFIYELSVLGLIDSEDYGDIIENGSWIYSYDSYGRITFSIRYYESKIVWEGTSMYYTTEGEWNLKEIITNKELLLCRQYIKEEMNIK